MNKTGVGEKGDQTTVVEDVTETEVEEPEVDYNEDEDDYLSSIPEDEE